MDSSASPPGLFGQLLLGLINGSFYAVLSLGLAVIFGLLNIINFAHGAQYMIGAFVALLGLNYLGMNYWVALVRRPLVVGLLGVVIERTMLRHLYKLDHLYGLLLTFGLALMPKACSRTSSACRASLCPAGGCKAAWTWASCSCPVPRLGGGGLAGGVPGRLVRDRAHPLGATLRAATQRPDLVQAWASTCRCWSPPPTPPGWRWPPSPACWPRRSCR
jgi:branched-chain amino acid transport system permease protein